MITTATNDATFPSVGRIGETELEFPSEEGLRGELSALGLAHAQSSTTPRGARLTIKTGEALADIDWYGEVKDLTLDGQALIQFPCGRSEVVKLDRLVVFDDGFDAELGWGGMGGPEDEFERMSTDSNDSWETDDNGPDEWATNDDDSHLHNASTTPLATGTDSPLRQAASTPTPISVAALKATDAMEIDRASGVSSPAPGPPAPAGADHGPWQRFEILDEAPTDHHFINNTLQTPSKAFSMRVQKEYKVLQDSLPENILVRAYEGA